MKSYIIIGTDTNCGKTHVSCRLLGYLRAKGANALALKPVASGMVEKEGEWINEDVYHLQQHNTSYSQPICGWMFKEPVSPHLAAKKAGIRLSAEKIRAFCEETKDAHFDYLFIETAGGLMSPLNEEETWLDVILKMKLPVLLVVGMRLGCLNHALLTTAVLQANHLSCLGWIANQIDPLMPLLSQNIETLEMKMPWPRLATLGYEGVFKDIGGF